jgi:hypothetical protein
MQHLSKDGEAFFNLCDQTMQLNPSCLKHYIDYFNQKRQDKEIEIIRDGKIISSKTIDLRKKDIIRLSNTRQLYIFKPNLKLE